MNGEPLWYSGFCGQSIRRPIQIDIEASSVREARKSHSTGSRAKGDAPAEQQHGSEHLGSLKGIGPWQCTTVEQQMKFMLGKSGNDLLKHAQGINPCAFEFVWQQPSSINRNFHSFKCTKAATCTLLKRYIRRQFLVEDKTMANRLLDFLKEPTTASIAKGGFIVLFL